MSERPIRILLIEDKLGDARLIREMLTSATQVDLDIPGFDVIRTVKLSTGLKRLSKGDIDVVLLDLSLPDSRGLDTFTKVHTQAPEVPVVILSDPEDKALVVEAVRKGAQDHLIKGQTSSALLIRSIHYAVKYARVEAIRRQTEETLRASEKRFRLLYENAPLAYHSLDKDGCLIEVNQAWLDMLGYSRDQVIGRWFGDFLSPQYIDGYRKGFPRFIATGTTHAECEMVQRDGSHIIVLIDGIVGRDKQGNFRQTHCILHDVTERKRAEEALQESEERHRIISKLTSDIAYSVLVEPDGTLIPEWVAGALIRITGFTTDELEARGGWPSLMYPEDMPLATRHLQVHLTGQPDVAEYRIITKDREARWLRDYGYPMWDETEGRVVRIIGAAQDITERKRAEAALRESEEEHRLLFETMAQGVVYQAADGQITSANPAAEQILGLTLDQMQGRTSADPRWKAIHKDGSDFSGETHPSMVALKSGEKVQNVTMGVFNPLYDEYRWINVNAVPQFKPGESAPYQVYTTFEDITDRVRSEQERTRAEEALRESRRRLRAIFDQTFQFMGMMTLDGTLTEANQTALDFAGLEESDVIGKPFWETPWWTHSPELQAQLRDAISRAAAGELVRFEANHLAADGSLHYADFSLKPVWDEMGNVSFLIPEGRDITERVRSEQERAQAEKALRESEERHRVISELTTDYIFRLDIDNDGNAVMSMVSESFFVATGRTLEEAKTPDLWTSIFHPQDLERAMAFFRAVVSSGQSGEIECRTYVKSGRQRWIQALAHPIWDEEEHRTVAILGAVKDITERKQAQEALQYRVEFEALITDISTHFINLASDEVDSGIDRALRLIGEFTDVDRSYVFLFYEAGATMDNTHEWCAKGIEPQIQRNQGIPTDAFRWSLERIRHSEVIHIPHVADLPPEANAEREEFQAEGIQSLIMVPIIYGRVAIGFLGLDSVRAERTWSEDTIALLRIVGEIFANALERKKAEAALRESEERYRQLFELESDALFLINNESGRILEVNAAASALYGYSHEELLTKRNTDLSAEPEDTQKVTQTTPITDQVVTVPLRFHRKKDGTVFPVEITGRFFEKQGQAVHIAAIRDITDRKRAEEQIENLNHLQGDLLNPRSLAEKLDLITKGVVSIFDADFARIWTIQAGDQCESGCVHAKVADGPHVCLHRDRCLHLLSSSGRYTHIDGEMHRRVPFGCYKIGRVASGEDPKFVTNDVVHDPHVHDHEWAGELGLTSFADYCLKSTTGKVIGVLALFSKHAISQNEDALLEGLANTTAQVILTSQAEEALERSEATLRSIFRAAPVGIGLVRDRVFQWTNETLHQMLGYSEEELKGQSARMVYPSQEEYEKVGREKYAEIAGRGTGSIETRLQRKDGEIIDILLSSIPIDPTDLSVGVTFTALDITERKKAEEALRESEEKYRNVVEHAHEAIVVIQDEMLKFFNPETVKLTGYSLEELASIPLAELVHPEDRAAGLERQQKRLAGEDIPPAAVLRIVDKQGNVKWVENNAIGITWEENPATLHFINDITERVRSEQERARAEEALRESEERYRELANSITDVFFAIDKDLRYTYWNTASEQLTGLAAKDALGKSIQEVFPDNEDTKRMVQAYRKVLRTQKPQAFVADYHIAGAGFFEISAYPSKDGISVFAKDITERKQTEEERERLLARIQEQARRVQQIIDTVPEGVILLDANARIVLANPLGRKDLNILADTLVGGTLTRLGDRPLAEILASPPQGLWHEIATEGRDFQVIARPVSEATETGPTTGGWVLVIRDVTQQRESERRIQQQERLAAVGQLAAGIAHDFNNIMAVITLYAGMSLRTPDVPQNVYERLETINQQAQRASDLIQQIMDFSRRAVLERGPMDLLAFMKEQVKLLQRTLPESIEINLSYGKDEYTVQADLTRIQQVIMNLATNARDAMPQGGRLHITLERIRVEESSTPPIPEMEAGEWVCVQVTDTGSGISDDVLPHIFNPFFTTKEPGKGTGLGLAQVYGIISQHEGHVDVKTEKGRGTTFVLYLPALSVGQPETPTAKAERLAQGQGQTILVVEDEATTRAAVVGSLELLGYQVLEAANGQEALLIFEQHATRVDQLDRIALVLSDVVMPEMGGQALFYTLKQQNPDVKVLLLTGHPLEEEGLEALRAQGLAGWLPKPPSLEQLAEAIAQVLGEK